MQAFHVRRSLETELLTGDSVEEILNPNQVIILTDDASRTVFLFKGKKAPLVEYWIGKRLALEIRKHMRGFYSIKELNDEESIKRIYNEPVGKEGKIPEVFNPNLHEMKKDENSEIEPVPLPEDKIILKNEMSWMADIDLEKLKVFGTPDIGKTQEKIQSFDEVPGHESELVLMGTALYNRKEIITSFMHDNKLEKKTEIKFHKLGNLHEGYFFQSSYSSRLIIEDGKLKALEFLRKTDGKNRNEKKLPDDHPMRGDIMAPVLLRNDLITENDFEIIQNAFQLEEPEPFDDVYERAKNYEEEEE